MGTGVEGGPRPSTLGTPPLHSRVNSCFDPPPPLQDCVGGCFDSAAGAAGKIQERASQQEYGDQV